MLNVAVIGATGYTAFTLFQLLLSHPEVALKKVFSTSHEDVPLCEVWPQFKGVTDLKLSFFDLTLCSSFDVVFLAVPHGQAHHRVAALLELGVKVIDLSADFRLNSEADYATVYGFNHEASHLLDEAQYGIPELFSSQIQSACLVANPGCYATSVVLALYPLVQAFNLGPIVVDAKSGMTGAGRSAKQANLFCEVNESFQAYSTGVHAHQTEISQVLGLPLFFSPHKVAQQRGILSSLYIQTEDVLSLEAVMKVYEQAYEAHPFVFVEADLNQMNTRFVVGSNQCRIGVSVFGRQLVVMSMVDNLVKGASGQAVQNMNVMFGLDPTLGLTAFLPSI